MRNQNTKKLVLAAVLIALGVAASPLYIPIGASKCFPVQHLVNVLAAVLLGPWYGVSMAFVTSLLRVLIGTGSLLAFPGSMCGALLAGLLYKYSGRMSFACVGEVFGTAVIGGMLASPVALYLLGTAEAALFAYVLPVGVSTLGGTAIAVLVLAACKRLGLTEAFRHGGA